MNFLRSKNFALGVAGLAVAAFVLPGASAQALLVAGLGVGLLWMVFGRRASPQARLYGKLIRMAHGDRERADRLIELEASRRPDAPRTQHIRSAIARWERDLN